MLQLKHLDGYIPLCLTMPPCPLSGLCPNRKQSHLTQQKNTFQVDFCRTDGLCGPKIQCWCQVQNRLPEEPGAVEEEKDLPFFMAACLGQPRHVTCLPLQAGADLLWVPLLQLRWLLLGPLWKILELEAILSSLSVQKQISNEQQQLNQRSLKLQAPDCQPFCLSEFSQQNQLCKNIMQHQHPFFNLCGRNVVSRLVWQSLMCKSRSVSI